MQAEVIAIGTELLLGALVDTNSAYLALQLATLGVSLTRVTLIRDDFPVMVSAIKDATERAELVICSGGLGPTDDDLTREAIAEALGHPLEFHDFLLDDIAARFAASNREMSPSNRKQAFVPQGAHIIRNPRGTAPAFVAQHVVNGSTHLIAALPGVPQELKYLTEHALLQYLHDEQGYNDVIVVREARVTGLPESVAGERIADMMNLANPVVGITANRGQHTIRIAATATNHEDAEAMIAPLLAAIEERFGDHLLGAETLEQIAARLLAEQDVALILREGLVAAPVLRQLVALPGGQEALTRGAAFVEIWDTDRPVNEATLTEAARALLGHVQPSRGRPLALLVVPDPEQPDVELRSVHFLLTDGEQTEHTVRGFDLRLPNGFEFVGTSAMELLRRRLTVL